MWGYNSETLADTCNTLIQRSSWDYHSFFDKLSDKIPDPISIPRDIPFKAAKDLFVKMPHKDLGKVDVNVDDNIAITPDIGDNITRVIRAIPLALHSIARPVDHRDSLPRVNIISAKKLQAEGTFEEIKTVLGWTINTRNLTISLPLDKNDKWTSEPHNFLTLG